MKNLIFKTTQIFARLFLKLFYRVDNKNAQIIKNEGAAVLVCNHVSFIDWLFITAYSPRPVAFVMHYKFMSHPKLFKIFSAIGVIPISSRKEDPMILEQAYKQLRQRLLAGELVCIFPEGMLTKDGNLGSFKSGVEVIVKETPVPVVTLTLKGMWGSFFSYSGKGAFKGFLTRFRPRVTVSAHTTLEPNKVIAQELYITTQNSLN